MNSGKARAFNTLVTTLMISHSLSMSAAWAATIEVPGVPGLEFIDEGENTLTVTRTRLELNGGGPSPSGPRVGAAARVRKKRSSLPEEFNYWSIGPSVAVQTGSVRSARFQSQVNHFQMYRDYGFMLQDFQNIRYNVFNWENGDTRTGTAIEGVGNLFLGHSFNDGENGSDLYFGGSLDVRKGLFAYGSVGGNHALAAGLETGLHVQSERSSFMISPQVTIGGQSCNVILPDGTAKKISSNGVGLGGVSRLAIGERTMVNAFYMAYPAGKVTPNSAKARGGSQRLNIDLFVNLGKITLTGQCEVSHWSEEDWNSSQFSIGVKRTFDSN